MKGRPMGKGGRMRLKKSGKPLGIFLVLGIEEGVEGRRRWIVQTTA
jgi:hypothetical protein